MGANLLTQREAESVRSAQNILWKMYKRDGMYTMVKLHLVNAITELDKALKESNR